MMFFEKVNPAHPDKIADRIAGALADYFYNKDKSARFAIEVLIGHRQCSIIIEASLKISFNDVRSIVNRIVGSNNYFIKLKQVPQDKHLSVNQLDTVKCGDNGIFKAVYIDENKGLVNPYHIANLCTDFYHLSNKKDGKVIGYLDGFKNNGYTATVCQSNIVSANFKEDCLYLNPLGDWTGGLDVDTGATNRKLGSDMGESITGGGLHGKDLSKADVSINIYLFLLAKELKTDLQSMCSIGDTVVNIYDMNGKLLKEIPYSEVVKTARDYIENIGGFEKFAEWGLIRPSEE